MIVLNSPPRVGGLESFFIIKSFPRSFVKAKDTDSIEEEEEEDNGASMSMSRSSF